MQALKVWLSSTTVMVKQDEMTIACCRRWNVNSIVLDITKEVFCSYALDLNYWRCYSLTWLTGELCLWLISGCMGWKFKPWLQQHLTAAQIFAPSGITSTIWQRDRTMEEGSDALSIVVYGRDSARFHSNSCNKTNCEPYDYFLRLGGHCP